MHRQRGLALTVVLILMALGALLLIPTLRFAWTSLELTRISRQSVEVQYALDAFTQRALWGLQYDTVFYCGADGIITFAECVGKRGTWTFTTQALPAGTPQTVLDKVNDQDVTLTIEVPGGLAAPLEPTPLPSPGACLFDTVDRDPKWAQLGDTVTYTVHISNCSSSNAQKNLRRVVILMDPAFDYVASSTDCCVAATSSETVFLGSLFGAGDPTEPEVNRCVGVDDPVSGCKANDNALILSFPGSAEIFSGATAIKFNGGEFYDLTFQAIPNGWGVLYMDVSTCFFAANVQGCYDEVATDTVKNKAPVVVGMFNLHGRGRGHAFGAGTGGGQLISKGP